MAGLAAIALTVTAVQAPSTAVSAAESAPAKAVCPDEAAALMTARMCGGIPGS
ncbi:hypothetical protein ACQPZJ_21695 [Actinoplanes sp. CA-054009]